MTIPRRILALLILLVAVTAMGQSWPPDTFRWFYHDSIPTKELKARAKAGDPIAINDYAASLYRTGRTADESINKSQKWWKKAADAKVPRALLYMIIGSYNNSDEKSLEKYLSGLYDTDSAYDMFMASEFMRWASNIPHPGRSILWGHRPRLYRRAAQLGEKSAQRLMAEDYALGENGVEINVDSAYHYLKLSGCYRPEILGRWARRLYPAGDDSTKMVVNRPIDAAKLYEYAVADTDSDGKLLVNWWLGELYYDNLHDYKNAYRCFRDIINSEYAGADWLKGMAYERLARCYRFGRGVAADQKEADRMLQEAYKRKSEDATELMDKMKKLYDTTD